MGLQNRLNVYMEEWGFRVVSNEGQIIGNGEHKDVDDELSRLKDELYEVLTDRMYFEYDLDNIVILTFVEAITRKLEIGIDIPRGTDIIGQVKDGKYDDEMNRYYAYLQAESLLENIKLLDFDDEESIEESLSINNIDVYEDDIYFRISGVVDSVDRTFDLYLDVERLLVMVLRKLKYSGGIIDFTKWYL